MSASKADLLQSKGGIDQGADWFQNFQYLDSNLAPVPLTGFTAELQMRSNASDPLPAMSLTNANGGIVITPATGFIACHALASITAPLSAGFYQYDLIITSGSGIVTRLVYGRLQVSSRISQ